VRVPASHGGLASANSSVDPHTSASEALPWFVSRFIGACSSAKHVLYGSACDFRASLGFEAIVNSCLCPG
jgi:hypothetical protein